MTQCFIDSEIGQLRRVLLHRPDISLERLTPYNCQDLLFDDVIKVERAREEHDEFSNILREQGAEVFLLKDLLTDILHDNTAREWLTQRQCSAQYLGWSLSAALIEFLQDKTPQALAECLLGGITYNEFDSTCRSMTLAMKQSHDFIIPPLPNHLYTRDASCWLYNGVILNAMAMNSRRRETVNLRAVYNFHPLFKQENFDFLLGNDDAYTEHSTLEGGDILVIGQGYVVVGMGERTSPQGVEYLAQRLFEKGLAKGIVAIELPKLRPMMHLDNVMTMLDHDCFSVYEPVLNKNTRYWLLEPDTKRPLKISQPKQSLFEKLAAILDVPKLRLIGGSHDVFHAEREQWNNAHNFLTLRPGVAVAYERNDQTNAKVRDAGIELHTFHGDELGRGRGGPRCMSCPFERDVVG